MKIILSFVGVVILGISLYFIVLDEKIQIETSQIPEGYSTNEKLGVEFLVPDEYTLTEYSRTESISISGAEGVITIGNIPSEYDSLAAYKAASEKEKEDIARIYKREYLQFADYTNDAGMNGFKIELTQTSELTDIYAYSYQFIHQDRQISIGGVEKNIELHKHIDAIAHSLKLKDEE